MIIIYKLQINNECYIGSTNKLNRRLIQHKYCCNTLTCIKYKLPLYEYIRNSGGWDCVNVSIILMNDKKLTLDQQKELEQIYIDKFKPVLNVYKSHQPIKNKKEYDKTRYSNLTKFLCPCCNKYKTKHNLKTHKETKKYKKYVSGI